MSWKQSFQKVIAYLITKKKIEVLEKALDKACEELENLSYVKGLGQVGMCYKEWKEWCIKNG